MAAEKTGKPLIGLTSRWDEEKRRHYLAAEYSEAVAAAGGIPVLIPLVPEIAADLAPRLDAIILTGSASDVDPARYQRARRPEATSVHPNRDATDFALLDCVFREKKPVLGICYGLQSLNVFLGGSLVQDIPSEVVNAVGHNGEDIRHPVTINVGSRLAEWSGGRSLVQVNSTHHQAIDRLGRSLQVSGRAPDGIIEAVEGTVSDQFVIAVQWHPERISKTEPLSARLFAELVLAAKQSEPRA